MSTILYLYAGPKAGLTFCYAQGSTVTLGRNYQCDIVLDSYKAVSGNHCRITIGSDHVIVTDLGSTNGTFVDGKRIPAYTAVTVGDGGKIQLGNQICAFQVQC